MITLALGLASWIGLAPPIELSSSLVWLLWVNLGFFVWRSAWRFAFTMRSYGVLQGVFAVLRIPVANVIAIMAGRRAVATYSGTLFGEAIEWEKTPHDRHPARFGVRR